MAVTPVKTGVQKEMYNQDYWVPASAGMTVTNLLPE